MCIFVFLGYHLTIKKTMIIGTHTILYSNNADKDRAFFRDILAFDSVDAGHGWLIFALPPGEVAVHPAEGEQSHELYLMCDDIQQTIKELTSKGVECSEIHEARWGSVTMITLPGESEMGIYQPKHSLAIKQ